MKAWKNTLDHHRSPHVTTVPSAKAAARKGMRHNFVEGSWADLGLWSCYLVTKSCANSVQNAIGQWTASPNFWHATYYDNLY